MKSGDPHEQLRKILNRYGDEAVGLVVAILKAKNKKASGKLLNSFSYKIIEDTQGLLSLGLFSDTDYAEFVDKGRKPGKRPPMKAIESWVKTKGIGGSQKEQKSLSFLIARKIGRFGIKPTPYIGPVLDKISKDLIQEIERNKQLTQNLIPDLKVTVVL